MNMTRLWSGIRFCSLLLLGHDLLAKGHQQITFGRASLFFHNYSRSDRSSKANSRE